MPIDGSGSHRGSRLRQAVSTSILSKVLGAVVQLISLPILLSTLGAERFAAYLALTAFVAWVAPLGLGVLPALTRHLASAAASHQQNEERRLFGAGFWFTGVVALAIIAGTLVVATFLDVGKLLGDFQGIADREITWAFVAAMGLTGAYFFGNTAAAVRAGYQEMHISNRLSVIANLITIAALFALSGRDVAISHFVLAVYAPLTVLMLMDIGRIVAARAYLWPAPVPRLQEVSGQGVLGALFRTSGVTWLSQLHGFIVAHASVLIVAHRFGAQDIAAFGALMRALLIVYAVVGLYVWPLVPAVADAAARGDAKWALHSWKRSILLTFALSGIAAALLVLAGQPLMTLWLGSEIEVPPLMAIGFAMFVLGFNMNFLGFNFCLSLGATRFLGLTYTVEILIFVGLAYSLSPLFGASGVALALGIASLSLNFWLLPWRCWRHLSRIPARG